MYAVWQSRFWSSAADKAALQLFAEFPIPKDTKRPFVDADVPHQKVNTPPARSEFITRSEALCGCIYVGVVPGAPGLYCNLDNGKDAKAHLIGSY